MRDEFKLQEVEMHRKIEPGRGTKTIPKTPKSGLRREERQRDRKRFAEERVAIMTGSESGARSGISDGRLAAVQR